MANLDDVQTRKSGNDSARIEELVDMFKWPDGKWAQIRLLDRGLLPLSTHWIPIIGSKTKNKTKIPRLCLNIDHATGKAIDGGCPYCKLGDEARAQDHYYMNAIIREYQEDQPKKIVEPSKKERKTGFKDIDSRTWTPVRVVRMPGSLLDQFKAQKALNKVKKKDNKPFAVHHDKYGIDFNVMYDSTIKGSNKYKISKEGRTPLTEEELEFVVYDLTDGAAIAKELGLKTLEEAKRDVKGLTLATSDGDDDDGKGKGHRLVDDDDDDEKSSKKKGKGKSRDDDDGDDDDDDVPFKKKGKGKSRDDDDDDVDLDDDDDDDDEDDEDEKPSKKSKKKSKKSRDDDDDDDEDDED